MDSIKARIASCITRYGRDKPRFVYGIGIIDYVYIDDECAIQIGMRNLQGGWIDCSTDKLPELEYIGKNIYFSKEGLYNKTWLFVEKFVFKYGPCELKYE